MSYIKLRQGGVYVQALLSLIGYVGCHLIVEADDMPVVVKVLFCLLVGGLFIPAIVFVGNLLKLVEKAEAERARADRERE